MSVYVSERRDINNNIVVERDAAHTRLIKVFEEHLAAFGAELSSDDDEPEHTGSLRANTRPRPEVLNEKDLDDMLTTFKMAFL